MTLASGPAAQPHRRGRLSGTDRTADAHLKRQIMGREVVVAVTNGRLDGSIERSTELTPRAHRGLAEVSGTWEQIFYGEVDHE